MKSVAHPTDFFTWSLFPPPKNNCFLLGCHREQSRRRPGQEGNRNSAQPLLHLPAKDLHTVGGKGSTGGYLRLRKLQPKNSLSQRTWAVGSHPRLVECTLAIYTKDLNDVHALRPTNFICRHFILMKE